jgi:phenylpropionate dioxygenase-like ring-hydroxylating dioxygenase large terminal subunit
MAAEMNWNEKRWFSRYPELSTDPIPLEPYLSERQFELERERIWPHVWLMMGRVEEIAEPGQYFVKDIPICNASILVVRGKDGKVRAFHNVCSHRGNQVCWEERGAASALKCRFHGFIYDLDGALRSVPDEQMFFNLDKRANGLTPVATDIWEGFIFINLDPHPRETLKEYLGEVGERLSGHPFHEAPRYYEYKAELRCNWKVVIYGFLEAWHVVFLHDKSAGELFGSKENPFGHNLLIKLSDKHRFISLYGNPDYQATPVGGMAFRFGKSLMQVESDTSKMLRTMNPTRSPCWSFDLNNIFPNFQLNVVNGAWYCHRFWPLAVDRTIWESRMYFPPPANAGERFFQEYSKVTTRNVLLEDGSLLEKTQAVMASGAKRHWHLQDEEIAIRHFHDVVQKFVERASV